MKTLGIAPTLDGLAKGPFFDSKGLLVGFPVDNKTKSVEVKLLDGSRGTWQLMATDKDGSKDVINMQGNRIITAVGVEGLTAEGTLI